MKSNPLKSEVLPYTASLVPSGNLNRRVAFIWTHMMILGFFKPVYNTVFSVHIFVGLSSIVDP